MHVSQTFARQRVEDLTRRFALAFSDVVIGCVGATGVSELAATQSARVQLKELWRKLDDLAVQTKRLFTSLSGIKAAGTA